MKSELMDKINDLAPGGEILLYFKSPRDSKYYPCKIRMIGPIKKENEAV